MTRQLLLEHEAYEKALAVLSKEQQTYMPSRRQRIVFKAFNIVVYSFVGAFLTLAVLAARGTPDAYLEPVGAIVLLLFIGIIPLFILNWGLVSKLRRQAKLRRELGLEPQLKKAFRGAGRFTVGRLLTILIAAFGMIILVVGILLVTAYVIFEGLDFISPSEEALIVLGVAFACLMVGASLFSLHFMRRGQKRLQLVQELQNALEKAKDTAGESPQIDPDTYDRIARLEREQIIKERAGSIKAAAKEDEKTRYLLDFSENYYAAIQDLSELETNSVARKILQVSRNPISQSDSPKSDDLQASIPGTDLKIHYSVDADKRLITLHTVERSRDAGHLALAMEA